MATLDLDLGRGETRARRRLKRLAGNAMVARCGVILLIFLLWEIAARTVVDPEFLSPPSTVLYTLVTQTFADPKIVHSIWLTFYELAVAYVLAVIFGGAVGIAVGINRRTHRTVYPLVLLIYAVPQITVLPLFIMLFGLGPESKIAFGWSHGIFPIIVNVVGGLRDVNPVLVRAARSMGASERQILRRIVFPHMVPSFFTGMRLGMTLTLLGVLLAELYVSTAGIGYYTQLYAETFDPAPLFALIFVLATMAVLLNELVRRAELRFSRWRR